MYLTHFHLEAMPFEIGPDPKFLWLGSKHQEAFAILNYGIIERKGFVVITGEPGTGKSTLLNATIASFDKDVRFAKISEPAMTTMDFVNFAADAFDMGQNFTSKGEFLIRLKHFIRESGDRRLTLVIDEAQRLSAEMLEQIRVFSDIEAPGHRAFSCIFAGQPEFLATITQNPALCQRIFFSHALQLLTLQETGEYIAHRLKVSGRGEPLFTPAAIDEIYALSRGNPRLINILCDQALLTGYASLLTQIGPEMIREGTESTLIPLNTVVKAPAPPAETAAPSPAETHRVPTRAPADQPPSASGVKSRRAYLPAIAAAVVLIVGLMHYYTGGFKQTPFVFTGPVRETMGGDDSAGVVPRESVGDFQRQQNAAESRLAALQSVVAKLERDLKELRGAEERAAERGQALMLKEATIAELRQKLELSGASQLSTSALLESLKNETVRLQVQLAEANSQRSSIEAKLTEEQKLSAGLVADARTLTAARERVAQLEQAVSESNNRLARLEQAFTERDKAIAGEKNAREQANAELSARQAAVAQLQEKLEVARSQQQKLEADILKARSDNNRMQAQLAESKSKPQGRTTPGGVPPQDVAPPVPTAPGTSEVPDPMGVIDYVLKRKSR